MKFQSSTYIFTCALVALFIVTPISATATTKTSLQYIKSTCNTTTYPSLCYKTLAPYAPSIKTNPLKLTYTILSATIKAAGNTATRISTLSKQKGITKFEAAVISDCIDNLKESISEFNQVRKAMSSLSGPDKEFQISNAKTWASAALTDEDTCLDGFSGRKVNSTVKIKIQSAIKTVEKLTSISLSLINHLDY